MKTEIKTLEESLKIIFLMQKELKEKNISLQEKTLSLQEKDILIEKLQYRLDLALRHRYASRNEKLDPNHPQLNLFDEADMPNDEEDLDEPEPENDTITIQSHERKKTGKKPLPKDLPRIRREYDLSNAEKICCCGSELSQIGEEVSEQLEIIPALMYVICHVKKKYACKTCTDTIKQAKAPKQTIPKSMAGPGLIAHVLVSKFCDHLPLYRQENILKRCGIDISRATLCHWVSKMGELFTPLVRLLQDNINSYDIAYADETRCQVLKEPGRKATQKSYMWLFGGGPPENFAWVYQYHPGRNAHIPNTFFEEFSGSIHVDGYAGYHELKNYNIKLAGSLPMRGGNSLRLHNLLKRKKDLPIGC